MQALQDITLFVYYGSNRAETALAQNLVKQQFKFGAELCIRHEGATWLNYNEYCVKSLYKDVKTSHVLTVHWDGYILNPDKWNPAWLKYDYIGAPWENKEVGNSGFCLRSKKLLESASELPWMIEADDVHVCKRYRAQLETSYKFAPFEEAAKFSLEQAVPEAPRTYKDVFGFHGLWHVNNAKKYLQ